MPLSLLVLPLSLFASLYFSPFSHPSLLSTLCGWQVAVGLEMEKTGLEKECDAFQEECLREESRFHYLNRCVCACVYECVCCHQKNMLIAAAIITTVTNRILSFFLPCFSGIIAVIISFTERVFAVWLLCVFHGHCLIVPSLI